MARESTDQYQEGTLVNGYDYDLQCWVIKGVVQDCGHPEDMECTCYGRAHKGESLVNN